MVATINKQHEVVFICFGFDIYKCYIYCMCILMPLVEYFLFRLINVISVLF